MHAREKRFGCGLVKIVVKKSWVYALGMHGTVKKLLEYKGPAQKSQEWFDLRKGMMTASDLSSALEITQQELDMDDQRVFSLNDKQKRLGACGNPYSSLKQYIQKKCGLGPPFRGNAATNWGQMLEPIATQLYEHLCGKKVYEFGLLPHPTLSYFGASPDGITEDGIMLEIKCPMKRTITGVPPFHYWTQMQLQLEVADLDACDFFECDFQTYANEHEFEASSCAYKGIFFRENDHYLIPPWEYREDPVAWYLRAHENNPTRLAHALLFGTSRWEPVYWGLEYQSCVRVQRDRIWFTSKLARLNHVWSEVQHCRKHGLRKEYKTNPRKKRAPNVDFLPIVT